MSSKAYAIISTTFENDKKAMVEKRVSALTPSFDVWEDTHIIQHLNITDADQWGVLRITQVELAMIKKEEPQRQPQISSTTYSLHQAGHGRRR